MSVPPLLAASRLPRPALAPLCSVPAPSLLLPQRNTLPETARNGGPARPRVRPGPRAPAATPPLPEAAKPRRARCQRLGSAPSGSRSRERSCGRGPSAPPSAPPSAGFASPAFAGLRLVRIGRIEEISVCPEPVRLSLFLLEASVLLPPPPPPPALSACTLPHARPSGPPRSCTALPSFRPSGRGRPGPSCWRRSGPDSRARPRSPVFAPSGCPAAAGGCSQVRVLPPHIRMQLRLHACMRVVVQTRLQLRTHARAHACVTHAPERPERSADETACPCVVRMLTFSFFRLSRL